MFSLTIATDNAAFEYPLEEVSRLLAVAAGKVEGGASEGILVDYNGNSVGSFLLHTTDEDADRG